MELVVRAQSSSGCHTTRNNVSKTNVITDRKLWLTVAVNIVMNTQELIVPKLMNVHHRNAIKDKDFFLMELAKIALHTPEVLLRFFVDQMLVPANKL